VSIFVQDVVVTLFTSLAAAVLFTRVVSVVRPGRSKPQCSNCNACSPQQQDKPSAHTH
jgi:hypothetical protein